MLVGGNQGGSFTLGPSPVTTAANPDIPFSSASFSCIGSDFDRDSSPMHRKNLSIPDNYLLGKKDNRKLRCWSKATIWEPLDFLFFSFFSAPRPTTLRFSPCGDECAAGPTCVFIAHPLAAILCAENYKKYLHPLILDSADDSLYRKL
jgi:hypothetical protein